MGLSPLRVCLVGLIAGGYSGIPRYAAALTRGLDEVADEFPELQLELLTTPEGATAAGVRKIRVREIRFRGERVNAGPGRIVLEQGYAATARSDLLHFFDTSGPLLAPWRPFVTTVHDLSVMQGLRGRKARVQASSVAVGRAARCDRDRHLCVRTGRGDRDPRRRPGPLAGDPLRARSGPGARRRRAPEPCRPALLALRRRAGCEQEPAVPGRGVRPGAAPARREAALVGGPRRVRRDACGDPALAEARPHRDPRRCR
jgi:hypothetical protein